MGKFDMVVSNKSGSIIGKLEVNNNNPNDGIVKNKDNKIVGYFNLTTKQYTSDEKYEEAEAQRLERERINYMMEQKKRHKKKLNKKAHPEPPTTSAPRSASARSSAASARSSAASAASAPRSASAASAPRSASAPKTAQRHFSVQELIAEANKRNIKLSNKPQKYRN